MPNKIQVERRKITNLFEKNEKCETEYVYINYLDIETLKQIYYGVKEFRPHYPDSLIVTKGDIWFYYYLNNDDIKFILKRFKNKVKNNIDLVL